MDTLTIDEAAEQPTRIIHDIEKGELALVTKDGRPLFVAVPVDERCSRSSSVCRRHSQSACTSRRR